MGNGRLNHALRFTGLSLWLAAAPGCGSADSDAPAPLLIADAGFDIEASVGETTELVGTGSGPVERFEWLLVAAPEDSEAALSSTDKALTTFVPDVFGHYLFTFRVFGRGASSGPDLLVVRVEENEAPVARAQCFPAGACTVTHGRAARLDGRQSFDPEGRALQSEWHQLTSADECSLCPSLDPCTPSQAPATLADTSELLATFTAPTVADEQLVFRLVLSDGRSESSACLAYDVVNAAPSAALAPSSGSANPTTVASNGTFSLDASVSSDPDNDSLSFTWTHDGAASLATPDMPTTSVAAPANPGPGDLELVFAVEVSDGIATATTSWIVTVTP